MPGTGGGGKTATNASWIPANFWLRAPAISAPYSPGPPRFSASSRIRKMIPALGLLTNPLIESPGNCTAWVTPGCWSAISPMRFTTASLRSSVAPSGSWAKATR